jgi:hypothetical protein
MVRSVLAWSGQKNGSLWLPLFAAVRLGRSTLSSG